MPPDQLANQAADALAARRYDILAALAATRTESPVLLHASAPAVSNRGADELTVTVSFDPRPWAFVASRSAGSGALPVFSGPSLTLACAAANEALNALAPLESLIVERRGDLYRRTCPQYLQEVHFS